ncbi:S-adenosyl-L-methionine-dependent methyltransferase [Xylariaceae sp. AK1471]|nr:S-adenosyl-L-methionine-dependent methyltransferase [Xylariaceae sp. AK1471]
MSSPTGSHDAAAADVKPEKPSFSTSTSTPVTTTTTSTRPNPIREAAAQSPETYEQEHVHSVYESIAGHFSSTRYKPWPFIASFLSTRVAPGSVGLDVGCGNGKYLNVRDGHDVHMIGSDRSASLVRIARDNVPNHKTSGGVLRQNDVAVADGLALPFRRGCADFVLCIAVIHHMSTRERRVDALRKLLECLRKENGKVLVYVWALEQSSSRRGWDANSDQDQLVPWVMKANQNKKDKESAAEGGSGDEGGDTTYERFYHLYREGELEEDMCAAGGKVVESGYERDNWWVIGSRESTTMTTPTDS